MLTVNDSAAPWSVGMRTDRLVPRCASSRVTETSDSKSPPREARASSPTVQPPRPAPGAPPGPRPPNSISKKSLKPPAPAPEPNRSPRLPNPSGPPDPPGKPPGPPRNPPGRPPNPPAPGGGVKSIPDFQFAPSAS